jgi:hypothetical protein
MLQLNLKLMFLLWKGLFLKNELLGLEKLGYTASLLAPLGYRHDEDATQYYKS